MYEQVYSVMRLDNLAKLVPFATLGEIETIIVDAIRHGAPLPKLAGMLASRVYLTYETIE